MTQFQQKNIKLHSAYDPVEWSCSKEQMLGLLVNYEYEI